MGILVHDQGDAGFEVQWIGQIMQTRQFPKDWRGATIRTGVRRKPIPRGEPFRVQPICALHSTWLRGACSIPGVSCRLPVCAAQPGHRAANSTPVSDCKPLKHGRGTILDWCEFKAHLWQRQLFHSVVPTKKIAQDQYLARRFKSIGRFLGALECVRRAPASLSPVLPPGRPCCAAC